MARNDANDPLLGSIIGNYRVQKKLGSGAMGTVYLGEHLHIGKRVAIKVLALHLVQNTKMVERFMLEARAIGILEHPNIIEMFDFDILEDGRHYYTMEYLQGDTLSLRMKQGPLALWELTGILQQICDALFVVHENGIIHRDLKPSNVFLAQKGPRILVKILDFGIAKIHDSLKKEGDLMTSTGAVLGTPVFMSPEQALGQSSELTLRSDLYSLGVILFKILADSYPINGTGIQDVIAYHFLNEAKDLRQINPRIPEPLAWVVMQCLKKDPTQRFASSAHLFAAYQEAVASIPPDWVVPRAMPEDSLTLASLPGNLLESIPEVQGNSASNSFIQPVPPPPPPPDHASGFSMELSRPHPLVDASNPDFSSHSLLGGGSYAGERSAGARRKILSLVAVVALVIGVGTYFLFFNKTPKPSGVVTPSAPVSPEPPVKAVLPEVVPDEPAPRTIEVQVTSEPEKVKVHVQRDGAEVISRETPFVMEFTRTEAVTFVASQTGYLEKTIVERINIDKVHIRLDPAPQEPTSPVSPPPMTVPPPMKVMQKVPNTFGDDLL
ncbi:protein kinase [Myxococcota bacterium]|nr:protein kinase [Myxococcota bacterium]